MSFDISAAVEVSDTFDVELIDPKTGDAILGDGGKPCTITVYGPAAREFASAKARNNLRIVEQLKRRGKQEADPDEETAATASFLAACTKSFNNFGYQGMESGEAAFRAFYADRRMGFHTDRVNREMGDWANFTAGSPKTS
jgi:hypothetical protein